MYQGSKSFKINKMVDYLNNVACFIYTKKRLRPMKDLYAKQPETNMFRNVCETFT